MPAKKNKEIKKVQEDIFALKDDIRHLKNIVALLAENKELKQKDDTLAELEKRLSE